MQQPGLGGPQQQMQQAAAIQAAAAQMQSPPASAAAGFMLMPQQGRVEGGQPGRDINPSPNSTPGLQHNPSGHPGQAQTPPTLGGLDFNERSWAANQNVFLGGQRVPDKSLEDQLKQQAGGLGDMFTVDPSTFSQQERAVAAQLAAAQQQQQEAAARAAAMGHGFFNPHQAAAALAAQHAAAAQHQGLPPHHPHHAFFPPPTAQSPPAATAAAMAAAIAAQQQQHQLPPHMQQQPPHHQMPPRPRPEGGQDPPPPPSFLGEGDKKQDLVIDSWTNEDSEKVASKTGAFRQEETPKPEDGFSSTGWGGPPPGETHSQNARIQDRQTAPV